MKYRLFLGLIITIAFNSLCYADMQKCQEVVDTQSEKIIGITVLMNFCKMKYDINIPNAQIYKEMVVNLSRQEEDASGTYYNYDLLLESCNPDEFVMAIQNRNDYQKTNLELMGELEKESNGELESFHNLCKILNGADTDIQGNAIDKTANDITENHIDPNERIRSAISAQKAQASSVKLEIVEHLYADEKFNFSSLPDNISVDKNWTINLKLQGDTIPDGSNLVLTPEITDASISWSCKNGPDSPLTADQLPPDCAL